METAQSRICPLVAEPYPMLEHVNAVLLTIDFLFRASGVTCGNTFFLAVSQCN